MPPSWRTLPWRALFGNNTSIPADAVYYVRMFPCDRPRIGATQSSALSQPRPPATQSGGIALNGVKLVSNASLLSGFDIDVIRFLLESMLGVPTALTHYPDYITM